MVFVVSRKSTHMRKNSKVMLNPFICVINNNRYNYMGKQEKNTMSVELSEVTNMTYLREQSLHFSPRWIYK